MADNYLYDAGSSATAAGDNISGVMYPRVKVALGADGVNNADLDGDATNGAFVNVKAIGGTALSLGQKVKASSIPVTIASDQTSMPVAGDVASGATDSGNPLKTGGVGKTANPTAVTDGQRVNATYDKLGKQVVVGSIRDLKGTQVTTITASTSETTIVTAVASMFLDVYGLILANTGSTATTVTIKDSTAGTTQAVIYVPAGDTRGFMLPESAALKQTTVNTNWTATCASSTSSLVVTALYVKNL